MRMNGLVGNAYRSIQIVERSIGWKRLASRYRTRARFSAVAKKLVKKGMRVDHGKSMRVLSLSMRGFMDVNAYLKDNPDAEDSLTLIFEGRAGST